MESIDFFTILTCLSVSKAKVPLLDTYMFINDICQKVFSNGSQQTIESFNKRIRGANTILIPLLKDYENLSKIKQIGKYICLLTTKREKKALSYIEIKGILDRSKKMPREILYIQKINPLHYDESAFYIYKLSLNTFQYSSELFIDINGKRNICKDRMVYAEAKEIALTTLSAFEDMQKYRAANVEFDLIRDVHGKIWLQSMRISKDRPAKLNFMLKRLESIPIDSPDLSFTEKTPVYDLKKRNSQVFRRMQTTITRKKTCPDADSVQKQFTKKLSTIGHDEYEREESVYSQSSSIEDDANFLEMLARERFKQRHIDIGKIGKITPEKEYLMKEMKAVKKCISEAKLPNVRGSVTYKHNASDSEKPLFRFFPVLRQTMKH